MFRAVLFLGLGVITLIYASIDPASGLLPVCPFYHMTHLFCPGCGSQRALHALLHGQISGAFGYNPLFVPALVFGAVEGSLIVLRKAGRQVRPLSEFRLIPWMVFVVIMLFWVLRNIPFMPFRMLAPA